MIVNKILLPDGTYGPDIPSHIEQFVEGYQIRGSDEYELRLNANFYEKVTSALTIIATMIGSEKLKSDQLDDQTVQEISVLYPVWAPGVAVTVGQVYSWDGTLVEVLQNHTTQADWEPNLVPALFRIYRTDDGSGPIQWIAGIAVTTSDQVIYEGITYSVIQAHTTQLGWEPPVTPSLFTAV